MDTGFSKLKNFYVRANVKTIANEIEDSLEFDFEAD